MPSHFLTFAMQGKNQFICFNYGDKLVFFHLFAFCFCSRLITLDKIYTLGKLFRLIYHFILLALPTKAKILCLDSLQSIVA
jgi:hypothetical protein